MSIAGDPELSFEAAFVGLERIVAELQGGELDLAAALARFERGVGLLARCQALLDGVDRSVALLTGVGEDGTPELAPFDAAATVGLAPTSAPADPIPAAPRASRSRAKRPASPAPDGPESDELELPY